MNWIAILSVWGVALLVASAIFGLRYEGWKYQQYHEVDRTIAWSLFGLSALCFSLVAGIA